jgi:hypothetical protein
MPNIMFDSSVQRHPCMAKHYFAIEMTGLFSLVNSTDLEPRNLELNTTESPLIHPKVPEFDIGGSKF